MIVCMEIVLPWRSWWGCYSLNGEGYHANHHHDHQQGDEDPLPVPGLGGDGHQLLKLYTILDGAEMYQA